MQNGFAMELRQPGSGLLIWIDSLLMEGRPAGKILAFWNKTVGEEGQYIVQQRRSRKQKREKSQEYEGKARFFGKGREPF